MSRFSSLKTSILSIIVCLTMMLLTQAYAAAGCCSHHGGVKGCDTATNHQLCQDGSASPTCLCTGGTTSKVPAKSNKVVTPKTSRSAPVTTTTPTPVPTKTTKPAKITKPVTTTSQKGCCAKHGGVGRCDKKSGYKKCKDGTISSTCKC